VRPPETDRDLLEGDALGTISGWSELAAPDGHILRSKLVMSIAPATALARDHFLVPTSNIDRSLADCERSPSSSTCQWTIVGDPGVRAIGGPIVDVAENEPDDLSDDVYTPVGFVYGGGIEIRSGYLHDELELVPIDPASLITATVDTSAAPTPPDEVTVLIDTRDDGSLPVDSRPPASEVAPLRIPPLDSIDGAIGYRVVATILADDGWSTSISAGVDASSLVADHWLDRPSPPTWERAILTCSQVPGATLRGLRLEGHGETSWDILILDQSTEVHFLIPEGSFLPVPSKAIADAWAIDLDVTDFSLADFEARVTARSTTTAPIDIEAQ
jgi:hypothetical protein